jgi:hypothetical protein
VPARAWAGQVIMAFLVALAAVLDPRARRGVRHRLAVIVGLGVGNRLDPPQAPPDELEGTPPLPRRRMMARRREGHAVQPQQGAHHALSLPGCSDPPWPSTREDTAPGGLVERRMPGDGHSGAGGRSRETGRAESRDRALGRSHITLMYRPASATPTPSTISPSPPCSPPSPTARPLSANPPRTPQ